MLSNLLVHVLMVPACMWSLLVTPWSYHLPSPSLLSVIHPGVHQTSSQCNLYYEVTHPMLCTPCSLSYLLGVCLKLVCTLCS